MRKVNKRDSAPMLCILARIRRENRLLGEKLTLILFLFFVVGFRVETVTAF